MNIPLYNDTIYLEHLKKGFTGPELHKNKYNNKWVVKKASKSSSFEQILSESAADDIYDLLLIPVPKHKLDKENKALILQYIDGKLLKDANKEEFEKAKKELQEGFIIDALLANWDVIGLYKDNIILPKDGSKSVRIDNGGSFSFKATGGKKQFSKTVIELDTMRNKKINRSASAIFGDLTDTDIDKQIKSIIIPNNILILSLTPDKYKSIMKERLDYLIDRTVWTNASAFKNTVKETSEPEYISQVQKAIVKYFRDGWIKNFKPDSNGPEEISNSKLLKFINETLKYHGAVISGGFILKAIGAFVDEKSIDMDMYVPTEKAESFRNIMTKLFNSESVIKHVVSEAPGSFFKKNGILSVTKYSKNKPQYAEMDIVEVNSDRTPIDVVKNFDLTFCENWYDGKNVFMTYPEHVKTKHGFLENHYLNILFTGNPVLINRMKKYIQRGFKVNINNPSTKSVEDITEDIMKGTKFQQQKIESTNNTNIYRHYGSYSVPSSKVSDDILLSYINDHIETRSKTAKDLNPFEILAIQYYTGAGSNTINKFLYSNTLYINRGDKIFRLISKKFSTNVTFYSYYETNLLYYYFMNLYNAVQKGGIIGVNNYLKVYRGTKTWYLENDKEIFYYMNSFVSTTLDLNIGLKFGKKYKDFKNTVGEHFVYVMYIHPLCIYSNLDNISYFKNEKELLLTPYHRYLYLGEEIKENRHYKKLLIMPTDLEIPSTVETFIPWKANIIKHSTTLESGKVGKNMANIATKLGLPLDYIIKTTKYEGGRAGDIIKQTEPFFNMNALNIRNKRNITLKKLNIKKVPNKGYLGKMNTKRNSTIKNNMKINKNIKKSDTSLIDVNIERFTDPIPSFPGKPPTDDEWKMIKDMMEFIKYDKLE